MYGKKSFTVYENNFSIESYSSFPICIPRLSRSRFCLHFFVLLNHGVLLMDMVFPYKSYSDLKVSNGFFCSAEKRSSGFLIN